MCRALRIKIDSGPEAQLLVRCFPSPGLWEVEQLEQTDRIGYDGWVGDERSEEYVVLLIPAWA